MSANPVPEEQVVIDRAYEELDRMRRRAEQLLATVEGGDPDLQWALLRRVRSLRDNPRALCFGRLDRDDGEVWYIGRRHVEDVEGDPVVVEWRAPVALPYYRAKPREPMGLIRRRQFVVDGRQLLSIADDVFVEAGRPLPAGADDHVRGRDALMVELERARTGAMADIVATIQPEQDEIIRSDPRGILAVQGGPGTGKTAVGLHRAAYLLYGDDAMARANVLVVGPSRTFLGYIAQVLPSLGEHAVVQTTFVDLVREVDGATGPADSPETERMKGDGRMADVLARAVSARRGPDDRDLIVASGVRRLVVPAGAIDDLVDQIAALSLAYSSGRDLLRRRLLDLVAARYEDATGELPADGAAFEGQVHGQAEFKAALDRRWPSVAPASIVADLLSKPRILAAAADGVLDPEEQRRLLRRRGRAWTAADAPLVDEVKALVAGHSRVYGHVIVDEAQDLSPMQLRMLARRDPAGNMTLLGDLAQAVGPWSHRDWSELLPWLPGRASFRQAELRFGYRSTDQVLDLASRLLPHSAPTVQATESVRAGRSAPSIVTSVGAALLATVVDHVSDLATRWPTVAVITPTELVAATAEALGPRFGRQLGVAATDGLGRPVTVLAAATAKGLEFDAVVVVEPGAIAGERPDPAAGLRLLYVALTRPTQHLSIVASGPLPDVLVA